MKTDMTFGLGALCLAALLAATGPARADKHVEEKTGTEASEMKSDEAKSEEAKSEEAKSDEAKSDEAKSDEAKSDETKSDAARIEPKYILDDIVIGDPDAPVEIIEYASLTCPHCARFHTDVWPEIKEAYVDTGKAKLIIREVYFDKFGLWASMTARCGGEKGFYPMVDTFLGTQGVWTRAPDIAHAIHQIGRRAGLSNERLRACLADREYAKTLLERYKENAEADGIRSTPTFLINGEKHGNMSLEEMTKLIEAELD